ncbi:cobalt ECF transporter T component CbiQ [Geoglobus acetivorans]|uniref:Cobalt ECF transporter T component CbiQ n=1 Tax=Geoglobus acetivorans TaxID=565033 RepID=A0ABZ3H5S1_GEOAI|nr:cobalt ECF transporter T component CbiQ [Geoglobus acetivorans]
MHETLEEIQADSRKLIEGQVNVYFVIFSFILLYAFNKTPVFLLAFLIFSALSLYSTGFSYFRFLRVPSYFIVPALFVIAVITPGEHLVWLFSREGVETAFRTFLRTYSSLSLMFYLIFTTSIPELLSALKKLRLPDFVVEMMSLIYRSIQIFLDELFRLETSAESRLGFANRKSFVRTAALIGYSMFVKSLDRAEKLDMAMEARCYSGKVPVVSGRNKGTVHALVVISLLTLAGVVL